MKVEKLDDRDEASCRLQNGRKSVVVILGKDSTTRIDGGSGRYIRHEHGKLAAGYPPSICMSRVGLRSSAWRNWSSSRAFGSSAGRRAGGRQAQQALARMIDRMRNAARRIGGGGRRPPPHPRRCNPVAMSFIRRWFRLYGDVRVFSREHHGELVHQRTQTRNVETTQMSRGARSTALRQDLRSVRLDRPGSLLFPVR